VSRPGLEGGAALVDGEVVPIASARIPILDFGFTRSDCTYDVVAVWEGAFFRLDDHLDRFERSCRALHLSLPHTREEIVAILMELIRATGLREAYVEVICTRGVPPAGVRDPRQFVNRFYAFAIPYVWILRPEEGERGMDAIVSRVVQRIAPTSVDPRVKNFHWGDLTRAMYEAFDRDARYPILLDARGSVTEGPGFNVFALVDGALLTPAAGVLEGITRKTVLELAAREGIETAVVDLREEQLRSAAEIFASSTAGGIMPVTTLDGAAVGAGGVGPVTELIRTRYWEAHSDPAYATPVDYDA